MSTLTQFAWVSRIYVCSQTHTRTRGHLTPIAAHLVLSPSWTPFHALLTPYLPRFKLWLPVFVKLACESASVIFTKTYVTPFWIFWEARVIYWNGKTWVHLRKRVWEVFLGLSLTRQPLTKNGAKNIQLLMCQIFLKIFDVTSALVSRTTSIKGKQG